MTATTTDTAHATWCTEHTRTPDGLPDEHIGPRTAFNFKLADVTLAPHAFTHEGQLFRPALALAFHHVELEMDFEVRLSSEEASDLARLITFVTGPLTASGMRGLSAGVHPSWCGGHIQGDGARRECASFTHAAQYRLATVSVRVLRDTAGRDVAELVFQHLELDDDFRLAVSPIEAAVFAAGLEAAAQCLGPATPA